MAITKQQAVTLKTFHAPVDSRGFATAAADAIKGCKVYRRNGSTQTWVTRPDAFRVPTKFGMYTYQQLTEQEAHLLYAPADCPACHGTRR